MVLGLTEISDICTILLSSSQWHALVQPKCCKRLLIASIALLWHLPELLLCFTLVHLCLQRAPLLPLPAPSPACPPPCCQASASSPARQQQQHGRTAPAAAAGSSGGERSAAADTRSSGVACMQWMLLLVLCCQAVSRLGLCRQPLFCQMTYGFGLVTVECRREQYLGCPQ